MVEIRSVAEGMGWWPVQLELRRREGERWTADLAKAVLSSLRNRLEAARILRNAVIALCSQREALTYVCDMPRDRQMRGTATPWVA
jgi:hypothetical protein